MFDESAFSEYDNHKHFISISLRHTAVSNSFNRVRGLRNFQCKLNKKRAEGDSEEAKQRILLSKDRRILWIM